MIPFSSILFSDYKLFWSKWSRNWVAILSPVLIIQSKTDLYSAIEILQLRSWSWCSFLHHIPSPYYFVDQQIRITNQTTQSLNWFTCEWRLTDRRHSPDKRVLKIIIICRLINLNLIDLRNNIQIDGIIWKLNNAGERRREIEEIASFVVCFDWRFTYQYWGKKIQQSQNRGSSFLIRNLHISQQFFFWQFNVPFHCQEVYKSLQINWPLLLYYHCFPASVRQEINQMVAIPPRNDERLGRCCSKVRISGYTLYLFTPPVPTHMRHHHRTGRQDFWFFTGGTLKSWKCEN